MLALLLEVRLITGQAESVNIGSGRLVRVTGNINNISQMGTKCVIRISEYWVEVNDFCQFSQGQKIKVVGKTKVGVIDIFLGRLWLSDALIDNLDDQDEPSPQKANIQFFLKPIREKIGMIYARILPSDEAGLTSGIVLGDKEALGRDFYQQLINSGTVHIVVASGYNVMLVAGTIMSGLFWLLKRAKATIVGLSVMWFYALLSGAEPSVVRASIMVTILLTGGVLGRRSMAWWSLLLAGWVMVMADPYILESISFQLSMAASVGLMMVYPALVSLSVMKGYRSIEMLDRVGVMTTLATMITTSPVIWWHFGRVNLIGLVSNVLVLPLVPLIMILGVLVLPLGMIAAPFLYAVAHWVSVVAYWFG